MVITRYVRTASAGLINGQAFLPTLLFLGDVAVFDSFTLLTCSGICCSVAAILSLYWSMTDEDQTGRRCAVRISDY